MQCLPLVIKAPVLWHKLLSLGFQCSVMKTKLVEASMLVCPRTLAAGAQMAGAIGTGVASLEEPEQRTDGGADRGANSTTSTCRMPPRKPLQKSIGIGYNSNQLTHANETRWEDCRHCGRVLLGLP